MLITLTPEAYRSLDWLAARYPSAEYVRDRFAEIDDEPALTAWDPRTEPAPDPLRWELDTETCSPYWDPSEYRLALYDDNGNPAQSVPVMAGGPLRDALAPLADLDLPWVDTFDEESDLAAIGPVWCRWHGGSGYSPGYPDVPYHRFDTLADAVAEHDGAYHGRGFTGEGEPYSGDTPGVELDSETWVFLYDPTDPDYGAGDPYPDYVIRHDGRYVSPLRGNGPGWAVEPC